MQSLEKPWEMLESIEITNLLQQIEEKIIQYQNLIIIQQSGFQKI